MKNDKLIMMVFGLGSLILGLLFLFPIWSITLTAPQYPDGIVMYIWINQITGGTESTLQNMNILNHYVGMQYIEPDSIKELTYFPYIIGIMSALGILIALLKKGWMKLSWVIVLILLGIAGIYDFYLWLYDYGHNLSPTAPIKIPGMVYQPPLFGEKMLLNFKAESYPHIGTYIMIISIFIGSISFYLQKRKSR